jgi:hypothetical protein
VGIVVFGQDATMTDNNIFGNGTTGSNCGVLNISGIALTVPNNFWGAASGPGLDPADAIEEGCGGHPYPTLVDPVATKPFTISVKSGF